MPFLPFLLSNWRKVAAGLAVIAVIGGLLWWRGEIREAVYNEVYREQVEQAIKVKDDQITELESRLRAQQVQLERFRLASVAVATDKAKSKARVEAHRDQDRPVGPLLEAALQ